MARQKKTSSPSVQDATSYHRPEVDLPVRPEIGAQAHCKKSKASVTYRFDSSLAPKRCWEAPYVHEYDATASGEGCVEPEREGAEQPHEATREAVSELRRISGLTWEQLGQLFAVSRRSVHFWASGKPLNAENETRLLQLLDIVRTADRGDARSTRSALLDVHDGTSTFDLLVEERFDEARARLGVGAGRPRPVLGGLSAEAKDARAPLRPEELVEAQHDRVHRDPGRARAARTVRNSRRGTT